MQVLKPTEKNIQLAANIIKRGGLVVYPTDTVYGLGCNPLDEKALEKAFKAKQRRDKPFPILAYSITDAQKIAHLTKEAKKLAKKYWPGPLTMVLLKKETLPNLATCNQKTVGVRIPNHEIALKLIHLSNGLLVGTSANKTGEPPPRNVQEAINQLGEKIDVYLDAGPVKHGIPSTVIDLTAQPPRLLRKGPISLEEILKTLENSGSE